MPGLRRRLRTFLFPSAGGGAQPEVRRAIQRFRSLSAAERQRVPSLWGWLLGVDGTPPYKIRRDWIEWAPRPVQGQKCANCHRWYVHHVTGTGICDSVSGVWEGEWWCSRWTAPATAAEYREYQR